MIPSLLLVSLGSFVLAANAVKPTPNDRCGAAFDTTCLGSKYGNCCSQYNYCGSTPAYCGTGCQPGFGNCNAVSSSTRQTTSPTSSTSRPAPSAPSKPVSKNARCGASFGGQTCQGSKYGDCCSQYFYCGSTVDYCGPRSCQAGYGLCNAVPPVSGSSSTLKTSIVSSTKTSIVSSTKISSTLSSSTVTSSSSSLATSTSTSTLSTSSSTVQSSSSQTPTPTPVAPSSTISSTSTSSSPAPLATCTKEIVINGDFETGNISPWTVSRGFSIAPADGTSNTGSHQLRIDVPNFVQETTSIRQTPLNLPAGTLISCSFQWASSGAFEFSSEASIFVGSEQCASEYSDPSGYRTVSGTTRTTAANPNVQINIFYQAVSSASFFVDNVSVVATLFGSDCPPGST